MHRAVLLGVEPLELRLLVTSPVQETREVVVEADGEQPIGAVTDALIAHLGLDSSSSSWRVRTSRSGEWLDPDATLAASQLRTGDRLEVGEAARTHVSAKALGEVQIVIAAGPAAGQRFVVGEGRHVIGRSSSADLRVHDDEISRKHVAVSVLHEAITVEDLGSTNGTRVDGVMITGPTPLQPGHVVEVGRTLFRVEHAAAPPVPRPVVVNGRIPFNRPPRATPPRPPRHFTLAPPPDPPSPSRLPMATAIAPLIGGVGLALVMKQPSFLAFAVLSPIMAVWSFADEKRRGRRGYAKRAEEFRASVVALSDELDRARAEDAAVLREASPDAAEVARLARDLDPALWERRGDDADFLRVRVGWGSLPWQAQIEFASGGDEHLRKGAEGAFAGHADLVSVPINVSIADSGVLGIAAPAEAGTSMSRWVLAQLAVLHSPREVVLAAAVPPGAAEEWDWLTWLPHLDHPGSPVGGPHLATTPEEARALVDTLCKLVASRRSDAAGRLGGARQRWSPTIVVFLHGDIEVSRAAVAPLVESGPALGVHVLWLDTRVENLPGEAGAVVGLSGGPLTVSLELIELGRRIDGGIPDELPLSAATALAHDLAPVVDVTAGAGRAEIPTRVGLLEVVAMADPSPDGVLARWDASEPGVDGPLGLTALGTFTLDLRKDGPHALLGGTTGAGKSELLQTFVAGVAATHPPTDVTFLLVDYKGGAAFKDCVALPHTVGYVTDLDGHLVHRALRSLNAELHRRERILALAGAKDIVEMERRQPGTAPPSLLLIVDEFATLAKELPEFVDGVVNVAQRGRSLGIHLVLATQRPAGAINDNIRANTNLRMALRMNDAADSTDVINVPDAASLPRSIPGRALARTGHSELTELQVAYAGGRATAGPEAPRVEVSDSVRGVVHRARRPKIAEDESAPTDLQRLVAVVCEAVASRSIPPPVKPWLPTLPEVLPLADLPEAVDERGGGGAVIGLLDLPDSQSQRPHSWSPEDDGGLLVFGAGASGKTTLLRTLAVSLAVRTSPRDLHIYGLDFASRGLTTLESLPHCGSVIIGEDLERVNRLFTYLDRELKRRREVLAEVGVTTIVEYHRAAPTSPMPRLVVLLDGYSGFAAAFERVSHGQLLDHLPRLIADGRSVGIHFVITSDRRGTASMALMASIPSRIVLRQTDDDEYSALGLDSRVTKGVSLPDGRGFVTGTIELHVAVVGGDAAGEAQQQAVVAVGEELHKRCPGLAAPKIGSLPVAVAASSMPAPKRPLVAVLGIGDRDLAPVSADLAEGHFLIAGPNRSGRTNALTVLTASLLAGTPEMEAWLFAPRRTSLTNLRWAETASGATACDDLAYKLTAIVDERDGAAGTPILVVIDDAQELVDSSAERALETVARKARDRHVFLVAAAESTAAHRTYSGVIPEMRKDRHGLLLTPDPDIDGELIGLALPRTPTARMVTGRGYLAERGELTLVQVADATL